MKIYVPVCAHSYPYLYYVHYIFFMYTGYIWFEIIFTFSSAELFPMHVYLHNFVF